MSLPDRTNILVVGGGPTGLATAISLVQELGGPQDIVVVDALQQGENTSRALIIHAATLEALESIDCAQAIVDAGVKGRGSTMHYRSKPLYTIRYDTLSSYTAYNFGLLVPQYVTEKVLNERAQALGIHVHRPHKVVGMDLNKQDENVVDVFFEGGHVMKARYVIGADGAKSMVREIAGVSFADPDGETKKETSFSQMVLADLKFDAPPGTALPVDELTSFASDRGTFLLMLPLTPTQASLHPSAQGESKSDKSDTVYRVIFGVPVSYGEPPSTPPMSYIQELMDTFGPPFLSSDPNVNDTPVRVSETLWTSRFRGRSAIASKFFVRLGDSEEASAKGRRGVPVVLIGDAAHIHSPAGGQGMNLGLRDGVTLGPVIAKHMKLTRTPGTSAGDSDAVLREFAELRRKRALAVIRLTKRLLASMDSFSRLKQRADRYLWWLPFDVVELRNNMMRFICTIGIINRHVAWTLSGLGSR